MSVPTDHPIVAKVLAASPPQRAPATDPERQRLLASMAHHLLVARPMDPPQAMAIAERQLRGMEASGWKFSRDERASL